MTAYTAADAHAAVERGAAWLDEHCPTWFREIDLRALNLAFGDVCVLGQTAVCLVPGSAAGTFVPDYVDVLEYFHLSLSWAADHGFNTPSDAPGAKYEMLTIAWKLEIQRRLGVNV